MSHVTGSGLTSTAFGMLTSPAPESTGVPTTIGAVSIQYEAALVGSVVTLQPMPSLAEAWTLYQDTTREPGLVAASGAAHPLFLPVSFPGLSR